VVALSNKRAHARPWCHAIRSGRRGDTLPDVLPPRSRVCLTPDGPLTRRPVLPLCPLRVRLGDTKRQTSDIVRRRQRPSEIRLTLRHGPSRPGMAIFTAYDETGFTRSARTVATRQIDPPRRRYRGGDPRGSRHADARRDRVEPRPCRPPCFLCQSPIGCAFLVREWTAEGIQYWACDGCDVARATRAAKT
jgi:hypothetical protein